jgi:hypothetical protein
MRTRIPILCYGVQTSHVIQAGKKREEGESSHKEHATALRLYALPSSPQPAVKEANRRTRSVKTAPRLCAPSASTGGPTSGIGAQAHMSYTQRVGFWVQKSRTAARANTAPPQGHRRRLRR